ncbi:endonuclease/exonuclease/phosphatase family protein [Lederbergia sp. NSJ-179]|uniref:endonuclease/exonuclease/phosphatase family protein n=1 Tax=Lederbergia sp. NSJ-179 TaxID=2931402 RepID=UPI001FD1790F|nr:endonuclease/exonuclease/phosphatase family protein [Lederbergia sp. NSJ-179]MCJ7842751.1 endonuclease/exonuclease/phosphatase family protein [Lederbergia sp. NSJ-179]
MKIVQYNILDGCRTTERYTLLFNWLKQQEYDIAGFNEMNDWTEEEFQREMEKLGMPYTLLYRMESSPYSIGIASKFPIKKVYATNAPPFHHGLLHVKIQQIHFLVTHLSPFESTIREKETAEIADYIQSIHEPLMLMGDLNTLSPLDQDDYLKNNAKEKMIQRKFSNRQHILNGEINYQPMQTLLDAGLHDIGIGESLDHSLPTKIKGEPQDPIYVRIDYMLVNQAMLQLNPKSTIIRDDRVNRISDHYPVQGQFDHY